MNQYNENIWNLEGWKTITTNGNVNNKGQAVMGRGIAKQAAERFPKLRSELGALINIYGNKVFIIPDYKLVMFPTKNNWWEKSDLKLIEYGLKRLAEDWPPLLTLYMVKLGCFNGKLDWRDYRNTMWTSLEEYDSLIKEIIEK